jgi:DNA end-binding protein Ku
MATKSAISFGLVHIPISLHNATRDNDISFNQLHKEDHERIRYKKTCGHCGEEVSSSDIVKGYEYDKNKYVIVTEADLEKIKTDKDRSIHILHFAALDQISPVYYEKTYHAIPELGGDKAFELLRSAMMDEQKIAIAKTVMGAKETLLALIPRSDGMLIQTMFYNDEIKELPKSYTRQDADEAQLKMARALIASMNQPFDPSVYKDEYQERLRTMIADKIAGNEIAEPTAEKQGNVIDLMEALRESVERAKASKPKSKPPAKSKAKAG